TEVAGRLRARGCGGVPPRGEEGEMEGDRAEEGFPRAGRRSRRRRGGSGRGTGYRQGQHHGGRCRQRAWALRGDLLGGSEGSEEGDEGDYGDERRDRRDGRRARDTRSVVEDGRRGRPSGRPFGRSALRQFLLHLIEVSLGRRLLLQKTD